MADVVKNSSVHRKRSKKSHEKHHAVKRKKVDNSDHHHTKQTKIKNLSQFAKLVQTGKLEVPLSLTNYITDHTSLIDQLFTILTGEDIEGMLPDILKGVKLRKVKQLCYHQLQLMSSEELRKIITGELEDTVTCDMKESIISGNENITGALTNMSSEGEDVTSTDNVCVSSEGGGVTLANDICVNNERRDECENRQDMTLSSDIRVSSEGGGVTLSSDVCVSSEGGGEGNTSNSEEISPVILLSDISDNEHDTKSHNRSLTTPLTQVGITTKDQIPLNNGFEYNNMKLNEEKLAGNLIQDVPETSHILEMQLRKKLLEVHLRRLEKKEVINIQDNKEDSSLSSISDTNSLMELQLRQRALESLIIKRQ